MKTYIIIGADGFIGTQLTKQLTSKGFRVIALINNVHNNSTLNDYKNVSTVYFSFNDIDELSIKDLYEGECVVFNMAWSGVNSSYKNNIDIQNQNILFYLKSLDFAYKNGAKKIIFPGSAAECAFNRGGISGLEKPSPSDLYSATKVATRIMCQKYAEIIGVDMIWTLITSVYGPGRDSNDLISYVIKSLLKGVKPSLTALEQLWDYIYIDDLIRALIAIANYGKSNKIYSIGSGVHKPLLNYVEIIREIINPSAHLGIGELPYKYPNRIDNQIMDISELIKDTGFIPSIDFRTGIIKTINYFKTIYE